MILFFQNFCWELIQSKNFGAAKAICLIQKMVKQ